MNGEIPSVPIITLAGVTSLTDCKYCVVLSSFFPQLTDVGLLDSFYIFTWDFRNPSKYFQAAKWGKKNYKNQFLKIFLSAQEKETIKNYFF